MAEEIGCCGFPVREEEYFRNFRIVGIQRTFCSLPNPATVQKWRKETSSQSQFSLKAPQLIVHSPEYPTYRKSNIKIPENNKEELCISNITYIWERIK